MAGEDQNSSVNAEKNLGDTSADLKTGLASCPFCGGPAEQRLTDGPRRGFIGCFSCMIGTPFNAPYGEKERARWNSRAPISDVAPPMCAVHKRLDDAGKLECEIGNDCVACSLNERRELLALIAPFAPEGNTEDSVTVLRRMVQSATKVN